MKTAYFRFFAELNDFFSARDDGKIHTHRFRGRQSVKDRIEALGVPHTEIFLILRRGEPVDFSYLVQDGDFFSVYPVFQGLDIPSTMTVRPKYGFFPRFVLDTHLGKLARYLRMLGFDTLYRNDFGDRELARVAVEENRILLTRDHGLLKRKKVIYGYFIRYDDPKKQLKSVINRYRLRKYIDKFGRCIECNGRLQPVAKREIVQRLEPLTRKYYNEFYICPDCEKIYWQGSHYQDMKEFITKNI